MKSRRLGSSDWPPQPGENGHDTMMYFIGIPRLNPEFVNSN